MCRSMWSWKTGMSSDCRWSSWLSGQRTRAAGSAEKAIPAASQRCQYRSADVDDVSSEAGMSRIGGVAHACHLDRVADRAAHVAVEPGGIRGDRLIDHLHV